MRPVGRKILQKRNAVMIHFRNDYSEGALPAVLQALNATNLESTCGYGCDDYCARAADRIRARFACPGAGVHLMVGGTVTNLTAIAAFLRPYQAVIAPASAHICQHETGSIEAGGHKILAVPARDGKLTPDGVRAVMREHQNGKDEHMVQPKLVYISDATELGTIYTKSELTALRAVCDEYGLYLYLDGARMAQALVAEGNDLAPEDFARLCDAFYIGGTKNGLLFGEALVIANAALQPDFRHMIKQRGGMFAKGRLLGVQFLAYFEDDLWLAAARHSVETAQRIARALSAAGYRLLADSPTNQIFPIVSNEKMAELSKAFSFELTAPAGDAHSAIRFVTSWATKDADVDALIRAL